MGVRGCRAYALKSAFAKLHVEAKILRCSLLMEAEDNVVSADKHGFLTACDAIVASPAIHVLGPQESGPPSGLCGAEDIEVAGTKEAEADPDCPILGSAPPTGMKVEASTSGAPQSRRQSGAVEAAAVPDLVSRMLGGLPSWAAFAAADESEEEVHNAWGEHDTDDMLGLRAFELQQARGIEVPGTPTAAQARLAKRKQKAQEKAKRKTQLEVGTTESTGGHLFGMMSMLSNLTSATATGSAHDDDEESVHNAWGGDDSDSKFVERAAELEHVRGMVVPVLKVQTGGRERLAKRRQRAEKKCNTHQGIAEECSAASGKTSTPQSRRQSGAGEAAAVPDLVSRMLGGLPSWAAFAAADESEEEVHNAWGEHDTDDMLGLRAFELQQARGIEVPGTPTAAQARLAKRKQKAQEKAKRKTQLEVGTTESTGGHLFGMMSMLSNLTSATATGSAHDDDEESVHNAWGGDDSDSKFVERAAELEHVRGMVVPVLKVQTGGRERLAKRRQRAEKKCNTHQGIAETRDGSATSYSGRAAASVFSAAATSIVQFQRLLNYVASTQDDEIDEVFCIWGEDDTPERFHERLAAMELARSDQSGRLPHHRVLRQKRKGRASSQKKERLCTCSGLSVGMYGHIDMALESRTVRLQEPDDPFLLDLRQQIE